MLSDGAALYTPGLSENRGGASRYYSNDLLGNLWTIDGSSKSQAYYQDTTGFGTTLGSSGSGSVFGYGGGNGCQTDADTGLVLMGHRYYDTRIGRFITQDPAGAGDNWYAYADNSPTNYTDPTGLVIAGGGMGMFQDPTQAGIAYNSDNDVDSQYMQDNPGEYNFYDGKTGNYLGSQWEGATAFDQMNMSSMGPGMNGPMIAANKKDRSLLEKLAGEAGYALSRRGKHDIWSKPGSPNVKMPNLNKNDEKDVVDGLKKRLENEIKNSIQADINMSRPSAAQTFWASRTDAQLVAGSILAGAAVVGSYFIPGAGAAVVPILAAP